MTHQYKLKASGGEWRMVNEGRGGGGGGVASGLQGSSKGHRMCLMIFGGQASFFDFWHITDNTRGRLPEKRAKETVSGLMERDGSHAAKQRCPYGWGWRSERDSD